MIHSCRGRCVKSGGLITHILGVRGAAERGVITESCSVRGVEKNRVISHNSRVLDTVAE